MSEDAPPVTKYRYTLVIHGNSHDEIVREMVVQTHGGYMLDSGYETRDEFESWGGRTRSKLEHTNPEQTAETYDAELEAWSETRRIVRQATT
jgi:hypothetical protein